MKRVNEHVEGVNESPGFKKVRFFSGIDDSDRVLERTQGGKEMLLSDNGIIDAAEIYETGVLSENEAAGDFGRVSFAGLTQANEWDFDINFDMLFGNAEQQNSMGNDLNVPVFGSSVGVTKTGVQEFTQERPLIKENIVEIIDIVSDSSDDEVEIVGFNYGYKAKYEQKGVGVSYGIVENSNLGLEMDKMDYFFGESCSVAGCEMRYTREEKGKAHMDDSWLALESDHPILLDLWPKSDFSMEIVEPTESLEIIACQPAPDIPVVTADLEVRQEEQVLRPRVTTNHAALRETARRFARINYTIENGGNESASPETMLPSLKANELLGKMPGPFAEALKLVGQKTSKKEAQGLIEWKPSEENRGHSITVPLVPSLLDLSLKGLAQNAEGILSLELIPDFLRRRLTDTLCDTNRMSVHILKLLVEGHPTEIRIKNSSWLTETEFQQIFGKCQTKNLRILQLDLCGQCMFDVAFRDSFARSSNSFSRLAIISLRGACRLSDSGVKELLMAAPALRSINLGHCSLVTCDGINFIADYLGSNLRELYIDDCQKIDAMQILPSFKKFRYLEVLSVADIQTVTDQFISDVIKACGPSIKELDLANCLELTDCSIKTIGSSCANLCSLNISNLHNLTDIGVQYLANGCRSIQKLKLCRNEFRLKLPEEARVHPVFHASQLKKARGECVANQFLPNDLEVELGEVVQPKHILRSRILQKGMERIHQVLVQWADKSEEEATWEDKTVMQQQFPDFSLEDKASLAGEGIDTGQKLNDPNHTNMSPTDEAQLGKPRIFQVYQRRGTEHVRRKRSSLGREKNKRGRRGALWAFGNLCMK